MRSGLFGVSRQWPRKCTRGNNRTSLYEQRNLHCLPFNLSALYYHQTPTRRYGHAYTPTQSLPITGQRNMQLPVSLEWHVCSSLSGNNCHTVHKSLSSGASFYDGTVGFLPCPILSAKLYFTIQGIILGPINLHTDELSLHNRCIAALKSLFSHHSIIISPSVVSFHHSSILSPCLLASFFYPLPLSPSTILLFSPLVSFHHSSILSPCLLASFFYPLPLSPSTILLFSPLVSFHHSSILSPCLLALFFYPLPLSPSTILLSSYLLFLLFFSFLFLHTFDLKSYSMNKWNI